MFISYKSARKIGRTISTSHYCGKIDSLSATNIIDASYTRWEGQKDTKRITDVLRYATLTVVHLLVHRGTQQRVTSLGTQGSGCISPGGIVSGFCSLDRVAYSSCFLLSTIRISLPTPQLIELLGLVDSGNDREAEGSGKIVSEDSSCVFIVVVVYVEIIPPFWYLRLNDKSRAGRSCRDCEAS